MKKIVYLTCIACGLYTNDSFGMDLPRDMENLPSRGITAGMAQQLTGGVVSVSEANQIDIDKLSAQLSTKIEEIDKLKNRVKTLEQQLTEQGTDRRKMKYLEQQNGDLKRRLTTVEEENQQLRDQVADLSEELSKYKQEEEEAHQMFEELMMQALLEEGEEE